MAASEGKKPVGRPSIYNEEQFKQILERIAAGEPMAAICREPGMPKARTIRDWILQREDISAEVACAREDGEESILAECLVIADTPQEGVTEKWERQMVKDEQNPDGPLVETFVLTERKREDMLQHRKLRIETRLKLLACWNPKKYGGGVTLRGDKEHPVAIETAGRFDLTREQLLAIASGAVAKPDEG